MLFTVKTVYGNDLIYPACDTSRAYLKCLNAKTFTAQTIAAAKLLGATFEDSRKPKVV